MNRIKFALRHLWNNRSISLINIFGLTIGISACMMLYSIVSYEFSFDRSLPGRDRIYRVYSEFSGAFNSVNRGVPTGYYYWLKNEATGYEAVTQFHMFSGNVSIPGENDIPRELGGYNNAIIARPDYFEVFDHYTWLYGDPGRSLSKPNSLVITRSRAETYFGVDSPEKAIGKEVIYRDTIQFIVSGVVEDVPFNSDLYFTDFLSFPTFDFESNEFEQYRENWNNINSSTQLFIKLHSNSGGDVLSGIMSGLKEQYESHQDENGAWILDPKGQKYSEMHFSTVTGRFDGSRSVASVSTLRTLGIVAILILIVAAINFINLETAQANNRSKEVGVRKILGSSKKALISQFLLETIILTSVALVLATCVSLIVTQYAGEFTPEGYEFLLGDDILVFLVAVFLLLPMLAGLYPAIMIAGINPVKALKSNHASRGSSAFIRRILSVFQFTFSQVLIVLTLVVGLQINYVLNKDLGFRSEDIIYFWTPYYESQGKKMALYNELGSMPFISEMSLHQSPPSSNSSSSSIFTFDLNGEEHKVDVQRLGGDSTYIDFYNIELLAGRNISRSLPKSYIINETLMKELGFDNPGDAVGTYFGDSNVIGGVVRDFHTKSLKNQISPVAIIPREHEELSVIGLKFMPYEDPARLEEWIGSVENKFSEIYPDSKVNIQFLDETLENFYRSEMRTVKLARTATVVAMIVSCLGLFGLFTFTVMKRTKEIGIRKVLGASVIQILRVLTANIFVLLFISLLISVPLGYYFSGLWLQEFEYRIPVSPFIFVLTGILTAITALLTVSIRSVKAAKADPVDSLRYE